MPIAEWKLAECSAKSFSAIFTSDAGTWLLVLEWLEPSTHILQFNQRPFHIYTCYTFELHAMPSGWQQSCRSVAVDHCIEERDVGTAAGKQLRSRDRGEDRPSPRLAPLLIR